MRLKGQVDKGHREVLRLNDEANKAGSLVKRERGEREEDFERYEAQLKA